MREQAGLRLPLGTLIQQLRVEVFHWTQRQLAAAAGLTQPAISQIERGVIPPDSITLRTLSGLARAFHIDVGELARLAASTPATGVAGPPIRSGSRQASEFGLKVWLVQAGDNLATQQQWREALPYYWSAYDLMDDSSEQVRFLLSPLAQTHINRVDLVAADRLIDRAERQYADISRDRDPDPAILASLHEKRGWSALYRGHAAPAVRHFEATRLLVRPLGDFHQEGTAYHFLGRLPIESQTPLLFPALDLPPPPSVDLEQALDMLNQSAALHRRADRPQSVSFNQLWMGRALFLQRRRSDALRQYRVSLGVFEDTRSPTGLARVTMELARSALLSAGDEQDLNDALRQLDGVLFDLLIATQHPVLLAEAAVLWAYCAFLLAIHRPDSRRVRDGADACELAMRLHPHPDHLVFQLAHTIRQHLLVLLSGHTAREDYCRSVEERIRDREGRLFRALGHLIPSQ